MLLLGGSVVAGAGPAAAAETAESNADARFLAGTLLQGADLDQVANLVGVSVTNLGLDTSVIETGSVAFTALDRIRIPLEGGLTIPLGDLAELGAANQFAEAAPEGVSRSASGAVSDTGVVNTAGGGSFPSDARISLTPFLADAGVDDVVSDLAIELRAISAVAGLDAAKKGAPATSCEDLSDPTHCRDYSIAGGDLALTAPGLAALGAALTGTGGVAGSVDQAVNSLGGNNGPLAQALGSVNTALAPLVGTNALNVTVTSNAENSLDGIVNQPLTDGVVSIDLATGEITADLEALLGVQLDALPPNTELLTPDLVNGLAARVAALLRTLPSLVETALTNAVHAATVNITGNLCAPGSTGATCEQIVLGKDVGSGVVVDIGGSLAEVVSGTADVTVSVKTAGTATALPTGTVLTALAGPIRTTLLADGAVLDSAIGTVSAAVGQALGALAPVLGPLAGLASLMVNVQEAGPVPGSFREVALRLTVGEATGGLATLDIARAQVGPNALPAPVAEPPAEEPPAEEPPVMEPEPEPEDDEDITVLPSVGSPDVMPLALLGTLMMVAGTGLLLAGRRTAPARTPCG